MAKIQVYDQEAKALPFASVTIYDSKNNKLGALAVDKDGIGDINDSWLTDKEGKIVVTNVSYKPTTIQISKFNGNAFLEREGVTLGNVVIRSVKKKPKTYEPIVIKNPYENKVDDKKGNMAKRKSALLPIALGGIGLGALIFVLTMKVK